MAPDPLCERDPFGAKQESFRFTCKWLGSGRRGGMERLKQKGRLNSKTRIGVSKHMWLRHNNMGYQDSLSASGLIREGDLR